MRRPLLAGGAATTSANPQLQLQRALERLESLQRPADPDTYTALLHQCIASKCLQAGKRVHSHIARTSPHPETRLHNLLVQMYGACGGTALAKSTFDAIHPKNSFSWNIMLAAFAANGHLLQARSIFDEMPHKSVISWTGLISAYAHNGRAEEALHTFNLMDLEGVPADHIAFVTTIDACASLRSLELGGRIHSAAAASRVELHFAVATALISMYGRCRRVSSGRELFLRMPERNTITWTAMFTAEYQNRELQQALETYNRMPEWNVVCSTALIAAYAHNGEIHRAEEVFEGMAGLRNAVSWSTMIAAYNENGMSSKALELFAGLEKEGVRLDKSTYVNVAEVCAALGDLTEARRVRTGISRAGLECNLIVANSLITMFCKCGSSREAGEVFHRMQHRSVDSWNSFIAALAQNGENTQAKRALERVPEFDRLAWNSVLVAVAQTGDPDETRRLFIVMPDRDVGSWNGLLLALVNAGEDEEVLHSFRKMDLEGQQPNRVTYTSVLEACSGLSDLKFGRLIRCESPWASDVHIGTSLVTMFAKCESFREAEAAFDAMETKNVLAWTAMLSTYSQSGDLQQARWMFERLPGKDMAAWNVMITGYAQFGHTAEARELFDEMPERNVISWTAVLSSLAETRQAEAASLFFREMDLHGQKPNRITFLKALEACSGGGVTEAEARIIDSKVAESGLKNDPQIGVGLLNLFEKCGSLERAQKIFDELREKTVVAWSILIAAYSQGDHPKLSLELLQEMLLSGVTPTEITFVNALAACSHGGFLRDTRELFLMMTGDFHLSPFLDHYVCVVDLFGRLGRLELAQELLEFMPFVPNYVAWTALLSACKTQGDGGRGACIGEQLFDLNPTHSGPYRMVWNVVTSADNNSELYYADGS